MNQPDNELLHEIRTAREILDRATTLQAEISQLNTPRLRARYDDQVITPTPRFIGALLELMRARCEMLNALPGEAGQWWWGRCYIHNLNFDSGIAFKYGDRSSLPGDGRDRFAVIGWGEE